jgi:hypothetical protein
VQVSSDVFISTRNESIRSNTHDQDARLQPVVRLCSGPALGRRVRSETALAEDRAPVELQAPHSGGTGGGQGTTRGSARGGSGPANIEGTRSRSHGPAEERPEPEVYTLLDIADPGSIPCLGRARTGLCMITHDTPPHILAASLVCVQTSRPGLTRPVEASPVLLQARPPQQPTGYGPPLSSTHDGTACILLQGTSCILTPRPCGVGAHSPRLRQRIASLTSRSRGPLLLPHIFVP